MPFTDLTQPGLSAYRSAVETPGDFADFWDRTLREARAVADRITLTPVMGPLAGPQALVQAFDVSFPGFGGHPVKGWLVIPAQRKGPLPLVVQYVGYGGGRGFAHEGLHWAAAGYASFRMDTRGQGGLWNRGDTADPVGSEASVPGFMTRGILDPDSYYYRRLFTDAVRAIDALAALDVIDPARIATTGASQGGGIALAAAGLDARVTAVMLDVPYLCDFPRAVRVATRDPYLEILRYLGIHRDQTAQAFGTLRYFDGVCFARQTRAPALFSAALMDTICPPSTVYAAFNAYAGADKTIHDYEFNDHEGGGPHHVALQLDWLNQRFL